jgi:hypothetical protein
MLKVGQIYKPKKQFVLFESEQQVKNIVTRKVSTSSYVDDAEFLKIGEVFLVLKSSSYKEHWDIYQILIEGKMGWIASNIYEDNFVLHVLVPHLDNRVGT